MSHDTELERIRAEYARRSREVPDGFYAFSTPANLFLRQGQERGLLEVLREGGYVPLTDRRVLDLGCGHGTWLTTFRSLGAQEPNLAGIDLDPARIEQTKVDHPRADLRAGSATALPWPDASFDLVWQSTVFTSILDEGVQRAIAAEMRRVLKPGGAIVWLDFVVNNPRNRQVRGVSVKQMKALFPGCDVTLRKVTLAPPLARRVVPLSWTLAFLLEQLRVLNTHAVALIRPK